MIPWKAIDVNLIDEPPDPPEGKSIMWISTGVGEGERGDLMIKVRVDGTVIVQRMINFDPYGTNLLTEASRCYASYEDGIHDADDAIVESGYWYAPEVEHPAWWEYRHAAGVIVRKITIKPYSNLNRDTIYFEGSNNGVDYDSVYTLYEAGGFLADTTYTFDTLNETSYTYSRLSFPSVGGSATRLRLVTMHESDE